METTLLSSTLLLEKEKVYSWDELTKLGIYPTNLQCFTYYPYRLYQKGEERLIIKPLPHNLFKILRTYKFLPA